VPGAGLGRDPCRTPMQWDTSAYAGFSAHEPWLPVAADADQINVAVEAPDPGSILSLYRRLLGMRRQHAALSIGGYQAVAADDEILAYIRHTRDERLLIALNLGAHSVQLPLDSVGPPRAVLLSTYLDGDTQVTDTHLSLRPNEGVMLALQMPSVVAAR
jgi:alpha-glucosidase